MLQCHAKNCKTNNFPLKLVNCQLENENSIEFNQEFMDLMAERLDFVALQEAATELNLNFNRNDNLLLHKLLMTEITSGKMVCNECGHEYEIKNKIPNMLLQENQV